MDQLQKAADRSLQWIINDIVVGHRVSTFDEFGIQSASNDNALVRLHFGIRGDYRFTYHQLDQSFDLVGGHHNLLYSNGIDLEVENKSNLIETFGISFPPETFISLVKDIDPAINAFIDKVLKGRSVIFSKEWGSINSVIQQTIDDIILNPYCGKMQELFLLAKVLELLVLCLENYRSTSQKTFRFIKNNVDKEKVIRARDYVNERLSDPPNLSEVSKKVGLNEFKLKHGFKETFGETLFEYLTQRRLNLARIYLQSSEKTIAEISEDLGYSSPQHFHNQFKKRFGHTPNYVRKNP